MDNIRISQCLIVKNEERNIERALTWGKDIMFEQIVVDTGSSDRTVDIARSLGAKIYHFDWIDDFSAAKNFALSKVTGDWVVFLDADEYIKEEDAERLGAFLQEFMDTYGKNPVTVSLPLVNLDDRGKPNCVIPKVRIFSNFGGIRYTKRIHEYLVSDVPGYKLAITDVTIYHTGYTTESYKNTKKTDRNRNILLREVESNPDDPWNYCYLGDGYAQQNDREEALKYYRKAIELYENNKNSIARDILISCSYFGVLKMLYEMEDTDAEELYREYRNAVELAPEFPDFDLWRGSFAIKEEKWAEAVHYLTLGIEKQEKYKGEAPCTTGTQLGDVLKMIVNAARSCGDFPTVVKYSIMGIKLKKHEEEMLCSLLITLIIGTPGEDRQGILDFVEKLYDFTDIVNQLRVLKCVKLIGDTALEKLVIDTLPEDEKIKLNRGPATEEPSDGAAILNGTDIVFRNLVRTLENRTISEIVGDIHDKLEHIKEEKKTLYEAILKFTKQYPFWGTVDENGEGTLARERAELLKNNLAWISEFYKKLGDYRSKRIFTAILSNYYYLDEEFLQTVSENAHPYFDLDLAPDMKNRVFVDIGAYRGSASKDFAAFYEGYKKIYCYEVTDASFNQMIYNLFPLKHVEVRNKAAYSSSGVLYIQTNKNSAANQVVEEPGETHGLMTVEAVRIDEDIEENVSYIKIDTSGSELEVLEGCRGKIEADHPVLSVNVSNRTDHICRIAQAIETMSDDYRFYLRYYGGNALPNNCVLYAI